MRERKRIWVPEAPFIVPHKHIEIPLAVASAGVRGRFSVELVHAASGLIKRRLDFDNLVTDAGLDYIAAKNGFSSAVTFVAVGTGSSAPAYSDTTLNAEITRTSNNGGFSETSGSVGSGDNLEYWWWRRTYLFTESEANGNLSEIGIFSQDGATLWARQLFTDEAGNPTTITKTNEDQLRIVYERRVYPPMDDHVQIVDVKDTTTTVTTRAASVASTQVWGRSDIFGGSSLAAYARSTDVLGGRSGFPSGSSTSASSVTESVYVPGTFFREIEFRWGPSQANYAGGVGSIAVQPWTGSIAFQSSFAPKLPKLDTERLMIQVRVDFSRVEV